MSKSDNSSNKNGAADGAVIEKAQWYAVKTRPRFEKKLHAELVESGYETYLPLMRELRQWSDRKKWVEEPMFRGYLFVHIDNRDFWDVLQLDGAVHFVSFGGKYATIQDEQIEFIRKVETGQLRYEVTEERFREGDLVKVVEGPLAGFEGRWLKFKSKHMVVMNMHQLNRIVKVEVPSAFIKKIKDKDEVEE